ncbi:MAG: sensor histidine kinase, partial [Methyloligellaceae bacterium]
DPLVQRMAPKLISSLDRAIRLCADTLKFGRAKEAEPVRAMCRFRPLAEEVGDALGLSGKACAIAWKVDVPQSLEADIDRDQFYRILTNLCRNAMQAVEAKHGGSNPRITVSAKRKGAVVTITVTDSGPGVPEKARAHLFEPFQGSARKGGTGLGLAIAAELVHAHGGDIALDDGAPGATFRITLPDQVVELHKTRKSASA